MARRCLTSARFTMSADLLHQNDPYQPENNAPDKYGEYVRSQDPLTKEIIRVWKPYADNPSTPDKNEALTEGRIKCIARGVITGGIQSGGTTESFGEQYVNIDNVRLWVPAGTHITKRDRVTNIRDASGVIQWLDEENAKPGEPPAPTVFNVNGVTPTFDAFNKVKEYFVILEKVEI